MANEAEKAASEHRMVDVYQTTKKLYRQKRNLGMPSERQAGHNDYINQSEKEQDQRGKEHFVEILNCPDPNSR